MNSEKYWIGIDVGESSTSLCFLTTSNKIEHATAAGSGTRDIAEALARVDPKCIEAVALESGAGHRLPRELAALGFPVTTVDSFRAAKFLSIRSMKTDANDARGLAEVARYALETGISVHVKNVTCEQIRVQLALRHQLIGQRVAARGALRSHLRTLGSDVKRMASPTKLRDQVEVEMERMREAGLGDSVPEILSLLELAQALDAATYCLDVRLKMRAAANPITERFMLIPGVGPVTALSFFSAIENPHRFKRSADVGAYLGLVPRLRQSGSTSKSGRITRAGNKMTRSHLYMSAGVLMSRALQQTQMGDWAKSLQERMRFNKARVALARKLAVVMLTIWKTGSTFKCYPEAVQLSD